MVGGVFAEDLTTCCGGGRYIPPYPILPASHTVSSHLPPHSYIHSSRKKRSLLPFQNRHLRMSSSPLHASIPLSAPTSRREPVSYALCASVRSSKGPLVSTRAAEWDGGRGSSLGPKMTGSQPPRGAIRASWGTHSFSQKRGGEDKKILPTPSSRAYLSFACKFFGPSPHGTSPSSAS